MRGRNWGKLNLGGYVFPFARVVYLLAGVLFITNQLVPLLGIVLLSILLNAFLDILVLILWELLV